MSHSCVSVLLLSKVADEASPMLQASTPGGVTSSDELQLVLCMLLKQLLCCAGIGDERSQWLVLTGCSRCLQSLYMQEGDNSRVGLCLTSDKLLR